MPANLAELLRLSSSHHDHLCPRQVLGVRMGLAGMAALGWPNKITAAQGFVIIETDGCFADGIQAATGVSVGHRTLRVVDIGKIAATFVDSNSGRAIRLAPRNHVRDLAWDYAPSETQRYFAQLQGYQHMPEADLLRLEEVSLDPPPAVLLASPTARAACAVCGEEIVNQREVLRGGRVLCLQCAGMGYYVVESAPAGQSGIRAAILDRR